VTTELERTSVDFFFDPACPWTWITARWVVEVAEHRPIDITWRTFSLRFHNRDNPDYDWLRDELNAQYPSLRIIEAVRAVHGNTAVGRLYTELGTRIHHDRDDDLVGLEDAVRAVGFGDDMLAAGDDPSFDAAIEASTKEGLAIAGGTLGIPIIALAGARVTYFGPVLSPAPTGRDAVELWDTFVSLMRYDGVYEIKRTRDGRPQLGPRPVT
jgi:2-hydroxychromene-2-carboxylate isomerase